MEKYCTKCGAELTEKELGYIPWYMKMIGGTEFNRETGRKNVVTSTYCPNWNVWKIWDTGHTSVTSMPR